MESLMHICEREESEGEIAAAEFPAGLVPAMAEAIVEAAAPAAPGPAGRARGPRLLTEDTDEFELRYDPHKNIIAAHRCNPAHGLACWRTRTCNPSDRRPRQGRPIGELLAWALQAGAHPNSDSHLNAELPLED